jgi:cobalt-precorrin-5B (C1)-methyltransferase
VTGPELREPDLPRTAKVRTGPLRTGWTTGTCSAAAARAATTALATQAPQTVVDVVLPDARVVPFPVERCEVTPSGRRRWWSRTPATTRTSRTGRT